MKHLIVLFVLASLAIVGCADNTSQEPVSVLSADTPQDGDTPPSLERRARFHATFTGIGLPTGTRCAPPLLTIDVTGSGRGTHLGNFTIVESHCANPATGAFTDGRFVMTAANGDQLFGTYYGQVIPVAPPIFNIDARFASTGGTGRFVNATGSGVGSGTNNLATGEATIILDGTLSLR